ncbi:MAG: hypothetical protein E6K73_06440 [Candidatus Eisenbacteria bacterium]|uniref:Uncharacterized protein n=1 Tax=Eiseniibacteriota bacterium TaxID=2212470 RepID=A0A538SIK3_UNCEI|nr:MAG: hypothetical protein E6K73_06440 [Candidatus Eisenbacteria bacterium]
MRAEIGEAAEGESPEQGIPGAGVKGVSGLMSLSRSATALDDASGEAALSPAIASQASRSAWRQEETRFRR